MMTFEEIQLESIEESLDSANDSMEAFAYAPSAEKSHSNEYEMMSLIAVASAQAGALRAVARSLCEQVGIDFYESAELSTNYENACLNAISDGSREIGQIDVQQALV